MFILGTEEIKFFGGKIAKSVKKTIIGFLIVFSLFEKEDFDYFIYRNLKCSKLYPISNIESYTFLYLLLPSKCEIIFVTL